MPADRGFIERRLRRIIDEEEKVIVRTLAEVDVMFITAGQGGGSSRWTIERHRVTEEEVARVADRVTTEIRELAGPDAPQFAETERQPSAILGSAF